MAINNGNFNEDQMIDILSLVLGSRQNNMGSGLDLSNIIQALSMMNDPKRRANERSSNVDMDDEFFDKWREQEHAPRATGVPHIFTGGAVFPQTQGQQRAEKTAAALGMGNNFVDVIGSILGAWQDRKKGQG